MIDKIFGRSTVIYYIFLLLILVTWTNVDSLPPLPLRLAYLTAIMGPLWKERSLSTPIVLFTFVVISGSSFAISYMPVDGLYISIVLLISYMLCRPNIDRIKFPSALIILTILSLFVDFLSGGEMNFSFKLVAVLLSTLFISRSNEGTLQIVSFSIILISFVIAVEFIIMGGEFSQTVSTIDGEIDRKGWADPNYFGAVLGYGVIASFTALYKWPNMTKKTRYAIILALVLSFYTILSTASRGVFVAIVASVVILLFTGSGSISKKISFLLLIFLGVLVFYQLGFFDLILLRFNSDAGDAGGRTLIWGPRLHAFFNDCSFIEQCFGIGFKNARFLGTNVLLGSHNDYIAILTSYGYIGAICLLAILCYPFFKAKENKSFVLAATLYMATCMFSIEPFTGGHWSIYYFYLYIVLLSQFRMKNNSN